MAITEQLLKWELPMLGQKKRGANAYYLVCSKCKTYEKGTKEEAKRYESLKATGARITVGYCSSGAHKAQLIAEDDFDVESRQKKGYREWDPKEFFKDNVAYYIVCGQCKTFEKGIEHTKGHVDTTVTLEGTGVCLHYRCTAKDHRAGRLNEDAFDIEEHIKDGFKEWHAEEYYTPPRPIKEGEFWCADCRTIHLMNDELKKGLEEGRKMVATCACGNKIRPWHKSYRKSFEDDK